MKLHQFFFSLWCAASVAAAAPAGTLIQNQASAQFSLGQQLQVVNSETAGVAISSVCRLRITPDGSLEAPGQQRTALPGERATFAYQLTNTGNGTNTFGLQPQQAGGNFTPLLTTFVDLNGDGQPQPEEAATQVSLHAGASAAILLVAQVPTSASGSALVNLVGSCGSQSDEGNVARLTVADTPRLGVTKAFGTERLRPGEQTTVTVTLTNDGQGAAQEVTLTDLLREQQAGGLVYVPGTARTTQGRLEFSADAVTWDAVEGTVVAGVRAQVGAVAPGATVTLSFRVEATAAAENRVFNNVATVGAAYGGGLQASDTLEVRFNPAVAIGPLNRPLAAEGTPEDRQAIPLVITGRPVCFDHTAQNTGDVTDLFQVEVSVSRGQAEAQVLLPDGTPLSQPFSLGPGEQRPIRVCYDLSVAQPLEAVLTILGARGSRNQTSDEIKRVETALPELRKDVSVVGHPDWVPGTPVSSSTELEYTLQVFNPYSRPLEQVQVSDPLPAGTEFVSASEGGTLQTVGGENVVVWPVSTLAAGEWRTLTLRVRVGKGAKDDQELRNTFSLVSAEFPQALSSNVVSTVVWNVQPFISKQVSEKEIAVGDLVHYTLNLRNVSSQAPLTDVVVTDSPASSLQYVPGSSTLGGKATADPEEVGGQLVWKVPRLEAGQTLALGYAMRVLPGANGDLLNTVSLVGHGLQATAVASNRATATVKVSPLSFAPLADIVGAVYLDANGNALYDQGEVLLSGARIALAGGRLALTDARGRYHFSGVPLGTQALRLDLASVPAVRDPGNQVVPVQGLTRVDFPLRSLVSVRTGRDLSLRLGDLQVTKQVTPIAGGSRVTTVLETPVALRVQWNDPLPAGAVLRTGAHQLDQSLAAGRTTWVYELSWAGKGDLPLTVPDFKVVK